MVVVRGEEVVVSGGGEEREGGEEGEEEFKWTVKRSLKFQWTNLKKKKRERKMINNQ